MSMFGKISVGVLRMITGLRIRISSASTMEVYGRSRATLIIHMSQILRRMWAQRRPKLLHKPWPARGRVAHLADQGGPFHAQACRGSGSAAHHPIAFPQSVEDVIALGFLQGDGFSENRRPRWKRRDLQH